MTLTQQDELELDAFWSSKPRPFPVISAVQQFGAVTVTITCRVCGKSHLQTIDEHALVCADCLANAPARRGTLQARIVGLMSDQAVLTQTWLDRQAALDDDTATRWYALCADWDRVGKELDKAKTGLNGTPERIAAKTANYNEVVNKIARTQVKGGVLAELITDRIAFFKRNDELNKARSAAEQGLAELDAHELPF